MVNRALDFGTDILQTRLQSHARRLFTSSPLVVSEREKYLLFRMRCEYVNNQTRAVRTGGSVQLCEQMGIFLHDKEQDPLRGFYIAL